MAGSDRHLRITRSADGIVTWTLDLAGKSLNILTAELLGELTAAVAQQEQSRETTAVIIRSAKPSGFLAGADLYRIRDLRTSEEAEAMLHQGQDLFDRLESLPVPTVAMIHGVCLGGGLELALACRHRIACDDDTTQLGLPETKLGLIPGWGGTQRLPRIVGYSRAIAMILSGEPTPQRNEKWLIDLRLPPEEFAQELPRSVPGLLESSAEICRRRTAVACQVNERKAKWIARHLRCGVEPLPAPHVLSAACRAALLAMRIGRDEGFQAGLEAERREFCRLLFDPASRRLLDQFFRERSARC